MNRDDIIRIALEVRFAQYGEDAGEYRIPTPAFHSRLEDFAAIVTAEKDKEIERLREKCEELGSDKETWYRMAELHCSTIDRLKASMREAVLAEREACANVCEEQLTYFTPIPCPDKISGCLVDHHGPVQRKKTATECAAAIRARSEQEQNYGR